MTLRNRRLKYVLLTPIFMIASIVLSFANVQFASAATLTWDGSAGDNLFSTGANWNTGTAPQDGDVLSFPVGLLTSAHAVLDNDIVGLSLAGINVSGSNSSGYHYELEGENTSLTGDINNSSGSLFILDLPVQALGDFAITGSVNIAGSNGILNVESHTVTYTADECVYINKLSGTGSLVLPGEGSYAFGPGSVNFHGGISISNGYMVVDSPSSLDDSTVNVTGSGVVSLYADADSTWEANFNLSGSGSINAQHSSNNGCSGASPSDVHTATLTGTVVLGSDFLYNGQDDMVVSGTYTDNGHDFTVKAGATGTLTTPNGTEQAPTITTDLDGSQPGTNVQVVNKETATLNGTRGDISISDGGILMGTGTAANIYNGGTVAPGNSPGTLTVLESYSGDGLYQAEILDADTYDQLIVGAEYSGGSSAVSLYSDATLGVVLYEGWSITEGDQFTIIDNQSATAVSGTFADLAEGAQFTVESNGESITFSITYVGGDGNDIAITALNTGTDPGAPNTGAAQLILGNPALLAGLGIVTASFLIFLAIRRATN